MPAQSVSGSPLPAQAADTAAHAVGGVSEVQVVMPAPRQEQRTEVPVRGTKIPSVKHFNGDAASSKPKVVLAWVNQIKLALKQEQSADSVSIAVMHLDGNAATWRDTVFLPAHLDMDAVIPWNTFETEFKARFMDRVSCMAALKEFKTLSMHPKQSVQDFNDLFEQRKKEIAKLPFVSVPDEQELIDIYLAHGLRREISNVVQQQADYDQINSLRYWQNRAPITEALQESMKMRLSNVSH